jgi:hypothetical protein
VGGVGNASWAFSKQRWARSWRPRLRHGPGPQPSRAGAHKRGTTERFAWPYGDVIIEKAAAVRCWNRLLISPSKRSVVSVVEEMVKQKLVTLIVPSLVLDEFRRLGWIYPLRLLVSFRSSGPIDPSRPAFGASTEGASATSFDGLSDTASE